MPRFSANLGFLFTEYDIPDAIRAAKAAGFDAVEFHWPYEVSVDRVNAALEETGLPAISLNTRRGDVSLGENGLSALPGREVEAKAAIDDALAYAEKIGARSVHVMAGFADGAVARRTFIENLRYATYHAAQQGVTVLIEPLNRHDAPGYFLQTTDQAGQIINEVGAPNLKLMFDCYHVGRTEGDVTTRLKALLPLIGHIQFASVPDRCTPDKGELNYQIIFETIDRLNWTNPLGAEYRPRMQTEESLAWMKALNNNAL